MNYKNKENKNIVCIYRDNSEMILYGYVDENKDKGFPIALKWLSDREHLFSPDELKNIHITEMKFKDIDKKINYIEKIELFRIEEYYNSSILFASFERKIYHEIIDEWYDVYKNFIISSQILPVILDRNISYVNDCMMKLDDIANKMYSEVDRFSKFTEILSTTYINRSLLQHPLVSMSQYRQLEETSNIFKTQMFRFDEPENGRKRGK